MIVGSSKSSMPMLSQLPAEQIMGILHFLTVDELLNVRNTQDHFLGILANASLQTNISKFTKAEELARAAIANNVIKVRFIINNSSADDIATTAEAYSFALMMAVSYYHPEIVYELLTKDKIPHSIYYTHIYDQAMVFLP